jgi:hypothetical protein
MGISLLPYKTTQVTERKIIISFAGLKVKPIADGNARLQTAVSLILGLLSPVSHSQTLQSFSKLCLQLCLGLPLPFHFYLNNFDLFIVTHLFYVLKLS